jgi:hypothetical protein
MQPETLIDTGWSAALAGLPEDFDLEQTARTSGALVRRREVKCAADLLRLALGYGPCGMSLREAAAWATAMGIAALSDVALLKRLRRAASWLEQLSGAMLGARLEMTGRTQPPAGRVLRLVDGSSISRPGSQGTDWRLHAAYDLNTNQFSHLELTDNRGAEDLRRAPVQAGEIRIADRFYGNGKAVRAMVEQGADVIVRAGWRKLKLWTPEGSRFDLFAALGTVTTPGSCQEFPVVLDQAANLPGLPARLVVVRKTQEAGDKERQRLRRQAKRRGRELDPRSLIAADYMILLTTLDPQEFSAAKVAACYRLRWQVELAFKRMKSLGHIDQLPAKDPDLARAWLYAHLIAALLIDDLTQDFLGFSPSKRRRRRPAGVALANPQDAPHGAAHRHPRRSLCRHASQARQSVETPSL